ncbi:mitochondrial carrier [Mytilinidion resinicola]|uniref:Mitochondrial carrier n=1 Tax=Mytilinidion resinicola TaxID=574789 RepID=A0A6A6Y2D9_9PEZI|nr:mitochondrial carrier [Mytilinidion resinicola]KAF2801977.1 mitochondrial carrier [Mytilinidion resinicola]
MSADFWAGYVSGAAGILIGNPLDLVKTRLQAGTSSPSPDASTPARSFRSNFDHAGTLVKGATAPIIGYGALNAILFVTYNRSLKLFGDDPAVPLNLYKVWGAGAIGGLATFVVSAPTELVKCRAQVSLTSTSSWAVARDTWKQEGIRGLYHGGAITSVRDAVGYGFYFWSYEQAKRVTLSPQDSDSQTALKVMLCGGLAGVVTWASIFPLDVVKTRVQTQVTGVPLSTGPEEEQRLLGRDVEASKAESQRLGSMQIARRAYQTEGLSVFFRGLGICSLRAFVVNAVQWAVYEWMMQLLTRKD